MQKLKYPMLMVIVIAASMGLSDTAGISQSVSALDLPKVGDPRILGFSFRGDGRGRVFAGDENGKVQQSLELWEDQSKVPNVITYMLVGLDLKSFSVTWGRGAVNPAAFACKFDKTPEFSEKSFWVATATNGVLTFQEIQDGDVKGLFRDLNQARMHHDQKVNSRPAGKATLVEQNIMIFLKEKNRKRWLERGWLTPTNSCVRHF